MGKNQIAITDFYKSCKKNGSILPVVEEKSVTDQFYSVCLSEKMTNCNNCTKELNELKDKCDEQEKKLQEINRAIEICSGVIGKKEKKIDDLLSEIKMREKFNEPVACSSESIRVNKNFCMFENVLTLDELAKLRSIGPTKTDDSSFILNSVRFLYKNDVEKISSLSVTGFSRGPVPKEKICTETYNTIKNLFIERLTSFQLESKEFTERSKNINKLLKNAFINIKRHGKSADDVEMIRRINEKNEAN